MNGKQETSGKNDSAAAIRPLLQEALRHHEAGQADEAERLYRQVLALDARHADALHLLGVLLHQAGEHDAAAELIGQAIAVRGDTNIFHNNLGLVFSAQGKFDKAAMCFRRALILQPHDVDTLNNLGVSLKDQGRIEEATECYRRALALESNHVDVLNNLGIALIAQSKFKDAEQCYRQLTALRPDSSDFMNKLGCALLPQDKLEEALACFERALVRWPDNAGLLNNMAVVLKGCGRLDEAIAYSRKAVALKPDNDMNYANLLLTMVYASSVAPAELAMTAREFGERLADSLCRQRPFTQNKDPERRLRIGYVSADFRQHAVNYFFEFLLKLHDRAQFDIFGYSSNAANDFITDRVRKKFDHWRDIKTLSDDDAADLIEADGIDILVDLAGHTEGNRLMVFARKPAPVQLTWLGYPATTGMKAMDYRISDHYAEPEGMTEHLNVEALWRLPGMFCCYHVPESNPPVIDYPPFADNGYITFGCFNNFAKVTDPVLETWARVMERVPGSRLLLEIVGIDGPQFRASVEERLRRLGLPFERVILEPRKRSNQFVLYNRIDIALDPFPCAGGTTSMDTLWMGVPLITLAGDHFASRLGVTILNSAGLPELIAGSADEYVDLAAGLALDQERLHKLRHHLRDRVAASPLMDQEKFTRNMETAYRGMWRKWCEGVA